MLAILVFGFLVLIHEGGHYFFARLFNVKINEFSIGMGPKIFSKKSKKTDIAYSFRLLPFGGFVSMLGEDETSIEENAFSNKPIWQRMIITVAGALINIIFGIIVMTILIGCSKNLYGTEIYKFMEMDERIISTESQGLMEGDKIVSVDGVRVHVVNDLVYEVMRRGIEPLDIGVIRNGEKITLSNIEFPRIKESGTIFGTLDFYVAPEAKTIGSVFKHTLARSYSTIKMVWEQLYDLITGRYSMESVSGPVGVTQALEEAAHSGVANLLYFSVFISINLGVMNLLPIPALDGGRFLFQIIELVRRKPIPAEVEGYIHFAGLVLLMIFLVFVTFKDVMRIFG